MKRSGLVVSTLCLLILASATVVAAPAAKNAAGQAAATATDARTPAVVDSLGMLERAVARDSSKFDNLYRLGVMLMDRDRSQEAVVVLTKASTLRPADLKVLVNIGAAYDALGRAETAQDYYRAALKVTPGDSVASCRLASSLYASSRTSEAMDLLRRVIREKPGSYCAYFTLGVAFADAGIYPDAIRMWKRVVALAPQSPEAISATESIEVLDRYVKSGP